MHTRLDHLVVTAHTLEQGVAWCEATLGVTPGPGGTHALFGTHNRLLRCASRAYPRAYLEIIAIDPDAQGQGAEPRAALPAHPDRRPGPRWFDLDDAALQAALREQPRLVHWVASTDTLQAALDTWQRRGIDRGRALAASRRTPQGLLQWRISVRDDGARLFDGALPTLIEWGDVHPTDAMPGSGVHLTALRVTHPRAEELRAALEAIDLGLVTFARGDANLAAELITPKGSVVLESKGL
jgi:hypothetical protein